jgi:hypothetical protein
MKNYLPLLSAAIGGALTGISIDGAEPADRP